MTLLAIAMLALVSAALMGMSRLFSQEVRSARRDDAGAQVRQLLAAGTAVARERVGSWGEMPGGLAQPVALPQSLQEGGKLRLRLVSGAPARVAVEASWKGWHAERVLQFERADGRWQISGIEEGAVGAESGTAAIRPERADGRRR